MVDTKDLVVDLEDTKDSVVDTEVMVVDLEDTKDSVVDMEAMVVDLEDTKEDSVVDLEDTEVMDSTDKYFFKLDLNCMQKSTKYPYPCTFHIYIDTFINLITI